MNWKEIKKNMQASNDERWTQHKPNQLLKKKRERQNRKQGR